MASPINDPHPNDAQAVEEVQNPEDFFANEDATEDEGSDELLESEPGDGKIEEGELPDDAAVTLVEAVAPENLQPPTEDESESDEPQEEPVDSEAEVAADDSDENGGRRQYVVLQEVVLDQDALNELLKAVKGGIEPRTALIEVHRASVTNPKSALNGAWRRHKDEWVEPPRLAVVTANKIRTRKAKPRVREIIGYTFDE